MKHKVLTVILLLLIIIPFSTKKVSANIGYIFDGRLSAADLLIMASIFVVLIIIIKYFWNYDGKLKDTRSKSIFSLNRIEEWLYDTGADEIGCVEKLKKIDSNFLPEDFKEDVKKTFLALQNAWQAKKWEDIRTFESNSLYSMHKKS